MKQFYFSILLIIGLSSIWAQNPIVPAGMYIADPSAHVWQDGKLYVYGSLDESTDHYCSYRHNVLSTDDLINWKSTENIFESKGKNDQVPYNDALLFAPDCAYKNGSYYLYYCQPDKKGAEGVVTSKSPLGPFTDAKKMQLNGIEEIDPAVFIDDDGQAYYIWGQFHAKMAKLKPNMTEIDTSTITNNVVTQKEHFFHEGGYLVKRNGIYYFVYSHMGRGGRPTCIGYATSKSPMGPYKYGGVIIDNNFSDPEVWNNHGSIVEFNKQWYVFYHRSTHGSRMMRKTCIEPIKFNDDGSINEVEMTTQGASGPMNPLDNMDAARACLLYGNVRIEANADDNEILTKIHNGDAAAYKYFDFKEDTDSIIIKVAPGLQAGKIAVILDNSWESPIGSIDVPGNGNGKTWVTLSSKLNVKKGIHTVWLRFTGDGDNIFQLDWLSFVGVNNNNR